MSFLLLAYEYGRYGGDFHPIGRWKGEGSGFVAETIRQHQAEHYWPSYYSPPAYATPTMYVSSPYYSQYGYGGGYAPCFGYYGQPTFYSYYAYPVRHGYWWPSAPMLGY